MSDQYLQDPKDTYDETTDSKEIVDNPAQQMAMRLTGGFLEEWLAKQITNGERPTFIIAGTGEEIEITEFIEKVLKNSDIEES